MVRFGVLGPLLVYDGEMTVGVSAARQRVLLAALLVRAGHAVSVDALAETVWDGAPPRGAAATLRSHVMRLRRVLGPVAGARLVTRPPGYLIETGQEELDLLKFAALCREAGLAARAARWERAWDLLEEALGLWRGPTLDDVRSQILRQDVVPGIEQQRLQAIEWRIDAGLHLGRHGELTAGLLDLVAAHPLRERFHAQLMLALYRCGRQAEALAAYQAARDTLTSELGVDPGPELQDLHQRILNTDPDLTVAPVTGPDKALAGAGQLPGVVPRQLPATVRYFAGRHAELEALTSMLDQGSRSAGTVVISAIGGMAGVGKTALAVNWAHQVAERFQDGQLYVNLRGFDPSGRAMGPAEAIRGFLDALGVPPERIPASLEAQAGLYRSMVSGRRMLVVLDNARDEGQVRPLLPGGPECLVVVTSRGQLTGLVATEAARPLLLDVLTAGEAGELLAARLGPEAMADEPQAAGELVELCARLPLALSIAAARIVTRPGFCLAALAAELRAAGRRLDALDTGDPASSVRAVFSWSCERLSESAGRMFWLLGVHAGPDVSVPAAASLAGTALDQARPALAELTRAHLLAEHVPGRYALHDLLRSYAAELAGNRPCGEREAAVRRMLGHYLHTGHDAALLLYPTRDPLAMPAPQPDMALEKLDGHQGAREWFEAEHRVLLAALALADRIGFSTFAWQLAWIMADFLERCGHWREWAAAQQTALAAAQRVGNTRHQAHAHRGIGRASTRLGSYQEALPHLTRALSLFRAIGDTGAEANVHLDLACVCDHQGHRDQAASHDQHALALFRAAGHVGGQADALNAIGWDQLQAGNFRHALTSCREALDLCRQLGHSHGEAAAWDSLGCAYHHLSDQQSAITCLTRSLRLCRQLGDRYHTAEVLIHLGDAHHADGDPSSAHQAWQAALSILIELDHPDAEQVRARLGQAEGTSQAPG